MKENTIKKFYSNKLVNTHKLVFILIFFVGWQGLAAQEVMTLVQCIETAQTHNKNLQINRNQISISEEKQKEAKSHLKPKITANADYKYFINLPTQLMPVNALNPEAPKGRFRDIQFGVPHNISANVQLAMPLLNPQLSGTVENTKIAKKLAELQFQKTEEEVLFEITTLYYYAQILKNQLDFIEGNLLNSNKLLQNIQLLKDQRMATGVDVNRIQLQSNQLNTQKEKIYSNYLQVLNALKLNMGIALDEEIDIISNIAASALSDPQPGNILDLEILNTQNKLLNNELKTLNKTRFSPLLNLILSYGTTGFGYDKSPNAFLDFYPIGFAGLQLTYPIFDGKTTQIKINQKELEISNNQLQAQLISDKTEMEIENAVRQRNIAQNTTTNTENEIELAQTIYEQTLLQQKHGVASLTDVLLADNALREAQQNYLSAVIDLLKADLEIKKLTGSIRH